MRMRIIFKIAVVALSLLFIWSLLAPVADVLYNVQHAFKLYGEVK